MWTYLINSNRQYCEYKRELLPLEMISNDLNLETIKKDYIELVNDGFFESFDNYYDRLFVSEYSPSENPMDREVKFHISLLK